MAANKLFSPVTRGNQANIMGVLKEELSELTAAIGEAAVKNQSDGLRWHGDCGKNSSLLSSRKSIAATKICQRKKYPEVATPHRYWWGKTPKIVYIKPDGTCEPAHETGNCAGGTGAFLDQNGRTP